MWLFTNHLIQSKFRIRINFEFCAFCKKKKKKGLCETEKLWENMSDLLKFKKSSVVM